MDCIKIIYGIQTDSEGRCILYHSHKDVIANKCNKCGKFYACYKCHDELEDHKFEAVDPDKKDTVMCGACGRLYSYNEYSCIERCLDCGHEYNPGCSLHKSIYAAR